MKLKKSKPENTSQSCLSGETKLHRRVFLKGLAASVLLFPAESHAGNLMSSPVETNRLRPPGAVPEEIFAGKCIRCGRCVEVCPYKSIMPLDVRNGIYAGTPLVFAEKIPCYLCMKCVQVCPTGTLQKISQEETRMGLAIVNKHMCITWRGEALCRTCYNVCPFKETAIRLDELRPVVDEKYCTGCGLCTHGCPITNEAGLKAINIEPIYASANVKW